MGLSYFTIDWLEALHRLGAFDGKQSILELGPQDLAGVTPADIQRFARNVTGQGGDEAEIARVFFENGEARWWTAIRDFYAILGLADYHAADMDDERADYAIDLNHPIALPRKFDVITDFGTIEHVFNIGNAVKFIHDHLETGGLALHVLPTRGDYNHGFYNIHSTFYLDLCAANGYELVDFRFLPDFSRQNFLRHKSDAEGRPAALTLGALHEALDYHERDYAQTVLDLPPGDMTVNDYLLVALRKVADADFVYPMQGIYAAEAVRSFRARRDDRSHHDKRRVDLHVGLAQDYLKAGRGAEAETQIQAACALAPDDPDALYTLALIHWNMGRLAEAVATTERICRLAPEDAKAGQFLALLRGFGGNPT